MVIGGGAKRSERIETDRWDPVTFHDLRKGVSRPLHAVDFLFTCRWKKIIGAGAARDRAGQIGFETMQEWSEPLSSVADR